MLLFFSSDCIDSEISAQNNFIKDVTLKHKNIISPEDGEVVVLNSYSMQQQKVLVINAVCG